MSGPTFQNQRLDQSTQSYKQPQSSSSAVFGDSNRRTPITTPLNHYSTSVNPTTCTNHTTTSRPRTQLGRATKQRCLSLFLFQRRLRNAVPAADDADVQLSRGAGRRIQGAGSGNSRFLSRYRFQPLKLIFSSDPMMQWNRDNLTSRLLARANKVKEAAAEAAAAADGGSADQDS